MTDYMIIVAAGTGSRYGGNLPKQFCDLDGRPLLMTTLERMKDVAPGCEPVVVLSREMKQPWREMCRECGFTLPHIVVEGGATRALSVRNAVSLIAGLDGEKRYIGVHDAARPVVSRGLITALFEGLANDDTDGAIPATAVTDSLRLIGPEGWSEAVERSRYRAVQTPQLFPAGKLIAAYEALLPIGNDEAEKERAARFTDDASVMEAAGFTALRLTEGDPRNIKVTNPGDMAIASLYLRDLER